MKNLFLIIPLLTTSIYASASTDLLGVGGVCVQSLSSANPKTQLAPYIYQTLNVIYTHEDTRLKDLQKLIGLKVEGWHRSYPEGKTYKKRTKVHGIVQDVQLIKPGDPGKEIYEMTILSEENGLQKFSFSGSYSPAFSTLETTSLPLHNPSLIDVIKRAEGGFFPPFPFDLLSIGLDTPPEVAEYKESLLSQEAVIFNSQSDSIL